MTIRHIALQSLRRRKSKAFFVLIGLTIGVSTTVALTALAAALTSEINHKLDKYGANILIVPHSENLSLSYEGLSLGGFSFETREIREADLARLKTIKNAANIAAVGPMVLGPVRTAGRKVLLAGVDIQATKLLKPWWRFQGRPPGPGEIAAGAEVSRLLGLVPGRVLEVNGQKFDISGTLEPTGSQDDGLLFMSLAPAQALLGKKGLISMVEVAALCTACPISDMVDQITAVLPEAKVTAIQSVVQGRMETIRHFRKFSYIVSFLVLLVSSLVVLVTMMASVRERTAEIGIFRALGFRSSHVMRMVLMEAGLLASLSGLLGYILGLGAGALSLSFLGGGTEAHVTPDPALAACVLGLALALGLAASVYPAMTAARLDPYEALRSL
ncbi:MAG: FtsX-like permease family protein [Proteobacteria bacterium]|nr:FtsX-like permease family protein [Pseudomonadota bacterium]